MRSLASVTVCVCVLGLAAPEIARRSVDLAAEGAVRAVIDRAPGVHAGRIRSRDGARSIEIDDAAITGPGWRLTAGRIVLPGAGAQVPSLVTAAFARPAGAAADNVRLTFGDTLIVIPHLEMRGTEFTSQGLAVLLDPADAATLAQRLAKLTAAEISAPEVIIGSSHSDPATGDHLTLKDVSLTDVVSGRIGALVIQSSVFSALDSGATIVPVETARIALDAIDLPLALEMATASRTDGSAAPKPLFRSLDVDQIAIRPANGGNIAIESLLAGALKGRPLLLPPSDVVMLLDKPTSERTPADRQVLADLVGDAVGSAALDHLELRGVTIAGPGREQLSLKVARAALDGFEVVKVGSFSIEDAAFGAAGLDVSLRRFVLGGYDGTGVIELLKQQVAGGADAAANAQFVPESTSLALTDLHVGLPPTPQGMGAPDPTKRITIDVPVASLGATTDAGTGTVVSRATMEMAYDVSAGATDPSYRDMNQYGLSRLDLSADYRATFDPTAREIRLDQLSVDAQSLGQISMTADLGNASAGMFHAGQTRDEALQAAQTLVFQTLTVAFVNTGVVEKVLPPLAAAAKVSVPLFKAQMKAQAEISINQMFGPTPASARMIGAVRTFIDTPKNLVVVVKAPSGLSLATAASASDPKTLLNAVDIEVVANR